MEIESPESSSKQRNPKYSKSLKISSKSQETIEITESSQMKKQNTKTETTPKQNKHQTHNYGVHCFVPCPNHSLNSCGVHVSALNTSAIRFFRVIRCEEY